MAKSQKIDNFHSTKTKKKVIAQFVAITDVFRFFSGWENIWEGTENTTKSKSYETIQGNQAGVRPGKSTKD